MDNNFESKFDSVPPVEKEQTPEEIKSILEQALRENAPLDLLIMDLEGNPNLTPDLYVEEMDGEYAMMTYFDEGGEPGELIPLEITRIQKAALK